MFQTAFYDASQELNIHLLNEQLVTQVSYDSFNRPVQERVVVFNSNKPNPLFVNQQTQFGYDPVGNLVASARQTQEYPNGILTRYEYDDLDRRTVTTLDAGGADEFVTSVAYNDAGNLEIETDVRGIQTQYLYDDLDRRIGTIFDFGGPEQVSTSQTLDAVGKLLESTDEAGQITTYDYDALGRLTRETLPDPDGLAPAGPLLPPETAYAYDLVGNLLTETNGESEMTTYQYDVLNRPALTTLPNGDTVERKYDTRGNLAELTDGEQNTTTFSYDGVGRLSSETNERGDAREFSYDVAGNLISTVDRNGRTRHLHYDALGRPVVEWWENATTGDDDAAMFFVYDADGRRTVARSFDAVGNVISDTRYQYDRLGRLQTMVIADPDGSGTGNDLPEVAYVYAYDDEAGTWQREEFIGGVQTGLNLHTLDRLGRTKQVEQLSSGNPGKYVTFTYDAVGNLDTIERYTGTPSAGQLAVSTDYGYDHAHRLTSLEHTSVNGTTGDLAEYDFAFDRASRITDLLFDNDPAHAESRTFAYDDAGQLTAATHNGTSVEDYQYDDAGNRTGGNYVIGTDNRLDEDTTFRYFYDEEKNLTDRNRKSTAAGEHSKTDNTWDHRNRLVHVRHRPQGGGEDIRTIDYTYDARDLRTGKTVRDGSGTIVSEEYFAYDDNGDLALSFDGSGNLTHRYLHGPAVDQVLADEDGTGQITWPLTDHLGTVRDLVDSSGTLLNHIEYDSFGNRTAESDPSVDHAFGFTGREWDEEAGLNYHRARWYDPHIGRFISQDPSGFDAGDANLYRYVNNSPTIFVDPSGLSLASPLSSLNFGASNGVSIGEAGGRAAARPNRGDANRGNSTSFNFTPSFNISVTPTLSTDLSLFSGANSFSRGGSPFGSSAFGSSFDFSFTTPSSQSGCPFGEAHLHLFVL